MPELNASKRAELPDSAFAYVDSRGQRRLPINDEGHVRNALSRFNQVKFENEEARERARRRLLNAAKKYKIVPVGFITGQLRSERELGRSQQDHVVLPTGLVTLMMTDIEGSTALVHELGDKYGKLLTDVRRIIRRSVKGHNGHIVDIRADEAFAVFKRPGDAVKAAAGIQFDLVRQETPAATVRLRIGLHTGRPTVSDGNYIGISVHTAARVCSKATGGQVVVSSQTVEAVSGTIPDGVRFRSLGQHRLRGIPDPVMLYEIEAQALAGEAPPGIRADT
ncbi:MAG TPA: adenylate/guanylate cyclase domain-containing protein [Acidimicrobiia bacterium]|nr:adenylate/guanylate cyclase domain-containing protein [Acidimicrobiia bacterium]